jgi:hypothetical protein
MSLAAPKNHTSIRLTLVAFAIAASAFFAGPSARAQGSEGHPTALPGVMSGAEGRDSGATNYVFLDQDQNSPAKDKGAHEGIKLHGHWSIDVKNPDGTLVKHSDFENQLQYDGTQYLTALISGWGVGGDYAIYFTNATATATGSPTTNVVCPAPASTTTSTFPYCSIVQNINTQPGIFHCLHYYCVGGLTVTPTFGSGTGLPNVVLAGNITAPQAGSINNVYIGFNGCNSVSTTTPATPTAPGTITAAACQASTTGSYGGTMSGTTLGSPVTVVAGQIIQITVTYTFS